jgi:hypothetical protein
VLATPPACAAEARAQQSRDAEASYVFTVPTPREAKHIRGSPPQSLLQLSDSKRAFASIREDPVQLTGSTSLTIV